MKYIINDESLKKLKENDEEEWKNLIDKTIKLMCKFIKADSDVLTSDLYIYVQRYFKGGDILSPFRQYLFHRMLNEQKRQKKLVYRFKFDELAASMDTMTDCYNLLNHIDISNRMRIKCKKFMELRIKGYKLKEIADNLNCDIMKIKHISRFLKKELNFLIG